MMRIEVNRLEYTDAFKKISLNASLLRAARDFSLTLVSTDLSDYRMKVGNDIRIYVDDQLRFNGFIEKLQRVQRVNSDEIIISGRSKTADLIDSLINEQVEFRGQQSLQTVAKTLIDYLEGFKIGTTVIPSGIAPVIEPFIKVIVDEEINDFKADEDLNEEPGQSYFSIIEKFARKRSVLVTTNGNGDLVFTRGRGTRDTPLKIRNLASDQANNLLKRMTVTFDASKRYSNYRAISQPASGEIASLSVITPENLILSGDEVLDPNIRSTRRKVFITENSSSNLDCEDRAKWEAIKQQAEFVVYEVTTQEHSFRGNAWDSNSAVDVQDEFADLNTKMLIRDVFFEESVTGGETTRLVCVNPTAYTFLKPTQETIGELYNDLPLGFF